MGNPQVYPHIMERSSRQPLFDWSFANSGHPRLTLGDLLLLTKPRGQSEGVACSLQGSPSQRLLAPLRIKLERILISLADEPLSRKWHDRRPQ